MTGIDKKGLALELSRLVYEEGMSAALFAVCIEGAIFEVNVRMTEEAGNKRPEILPTKGFKAQ